MFTAKTAFSGAARMDDTMPILLVPGLVSSPRIFAPVMPALWRFGPVTVANHIRDDNMGAIARRILAEAPPRFALAGHSMGGYIAFEIMRQAPDRVAKLALINTQARAGHAGGDRAPPRHDGACQERATIAPCWTSCFRGFVHPSRHGDAALRQLVHDMGDDVGVDGFIRQQTAMIGARGLAALARLDQVPDPGADGGHGQHHPRMRCPRRWPTASMARNS